MIVPVSGEDEVMTILEARVAPGPVVGALPGTGPESGPASGLEPVGTGRDRSPVVGDEAGSAREQGAGGGNDDAPEARAPQEARRGGTTVVHPAPPRLGERVRVGMVRFAGTMTTPLLPRDYIETFAPLASGAELRGRIVAIEPETADAATVLIKPGRGWAGHVPGQYVRIGIDVDGVRLWRAYSLTSGPRPDGLLSVTVKAIPEGKVSNHLVHRARRGTIIRMDQATGAFHLPEVIPDRLLFVTAGSGITPVIGMLRHHVAAGALSDVIVLHSAPTPDDVIFGAELRALHASGAITLVERHTDAEGMLAPADLDDLVPDWRDRETWTCGPTPMLDAFEEHWAAAGIRDRMHTERFRPNVLVTGEGGTVSFTKSDKDVESDGARPILDAAEEAGVIMPSGCRMGICFGCVLPLRSGAVRDLRNGAVTTAEPGDGVMIQTCVSAAAGPCQIDN